MFANLTIKSRLIFVISLLSLLLVGRGVVGIVSLSSANHSLRTIYDDRLIPIGQLNSIVRIIGENRMAIAESINGEPALVAKRMDEVNRAIAQMDEMAQRDTALVEQAAAAAASMQTLASTQGRAVSVFKLNLSETQTASASNVAAKPLPVKSAASSSRAVTAKAISGKDLPLAWCGRDAPQGARSAVWRATQATSNAAARPSALRKW